MHHKTCPTASEIYHRLVFWAKTPDTTRSPAALRELGGKVPKIKEWNDMLKRRLVTQTAYNAHLTKLATMNTTGTTDAGPLMFPHVPKSTSIKKVIKAVHEIKNDCIDNGCGDDTPVVMREVMRIVGNSI